MNWRLSVVFAWQADYRVISLDSKQLDRVVQYVKSQRETSCPPDHNSGLGAVERGSGGR